jgi:hypothetical protein
MPESVKPRFTVSVKEAFEVYVESPALIRALHAVMARLYKKAHVRLTRAEKSALLIMIGRAVAKGIGPGGHN